jgi:hypothetical protein
VGRTRRLGNALVCLVPTSFLTNRWRLLRNCDAPGGFRYVVQYKGRWPKPRSLSHLGFTEEALRCCLEYKTRGILLPRPGETTVPLLNLNGLRPYRALGNHPAPATIVPVTVD